MSKAVYVMELQGGFMKSAILMTKEQVSRALTNWYQKDEKWQGITVKNFETGRVELFSQDSRFKKVTEDMISI